MSFLWPWMLASLLLVPLLAWLYFSVVKRRQAAQADLGSLGLLQSGGGAAFGRRRHLPPALLLTGLAVLLVAAARPEANLSLPRIEGTVILAFDVSSSMLADDLDPLLKGEPIRARPIPTVARLWRWCRRRNGW